MSTKRRSPGEALVPGRTSRRRTRKARGAVEGVAKDKAKREATPVQERMRTVERPAKVPSKSRAASKKAKVSRLAAAKGSASVVGRGEEKIAAVSLRAAGRAKSKRIKTSRLHDEKRPSAVGLARFSVGDVVRHKFYPFRGVVFDIDPVFANTEEWWLSIPENMRPRKNQPFYHLLAENAETEYIAYVSEQNLLPDETGVPLRHPQVAEYFTEDDEGRYRPVFMNQLN